MSRLFKNSLLVLSSILFLANTGIWITSEWHLLNYIGKYEYPSTMPLKVRWSYWSVLEGTYGYSRNFQDDTPPDPSRPNLPRGYLLSDNTKTFFEIPGLDIHLQTLTAARVTARSYRVKIDCWFVLLLTGFLPARRAVKLIRRKWQARLAQRSGTCKKCRYDLRAHKPGDKCPECGTLIETPNSEI
jgi:hypothetical protein